MNFDLKRICKKVLTNHTKRSRNEEKDSLNDLVIFRIERLRNLEVERLRSHIDPRSSKN